MKGGKDFVKQQQALMNQAVKLLDNYRVWLHHNKNFKDDDPITEALKSIIIDLNK